MKTVSFHKHGHAVARIMSTWLAILFLMASCTETKESQWDDGSLRSRISYRNGELHGTATWFHRNGNKREEFNYSKGVLEGPATRWYYNGNPESEDVYVQGKRNGTSRSWSEEGVLLKVENFLNDTLHGPYEQYYPKGSLMVEGRYVKGRYDGNWRYYNEAGMLAGEGNYVSGTGVLKAFEITGRLSRIASYTDNEKHGNEVWLGPAGDTLRIITYEHGRVVEEDIRQTDQ